MRHRLPVVTPVLALVGLAGALASGCGSAATSGADLEPVPTSSDALVVGGKTTMAALTGNDTSASSLFRDLYTPDPSFFGADIHVVGNEDKRPPRASQLRR